MLDIEELAQNVELFDGHYALIRPLSVDGATADVWLALDTNTLSSSADIAEVVNLQDYEIEKLGLLVAIKIYRPQNALDIEGEQRFKKEYMIVFNCTHTNLIHPAHFSIFKDIPYLVLPYCKQGSSELLAGNLIEEKAIWKYLYDVAAGLDYLHTKCSPPIIHLDMKPANVLINDQGNYAITDFGISAKKGKKKYSDDDDVSGTTAYMAPERFNVDYVPAPPSDIWALGATLYELITGGVPFGEEGGAGQAVGNTIGPQPYHLSKDVEAVITDCLNLAPEKRPSAGQLMKLAEKHLENEKKPLPKPNMTYLLIGATALLIIGGGALLIPNMMGDDIEESAREEEYQSSAETRQETVVQEPVEEKPLPAGILHTISAAKKALEEGHAFLAEHPDMINSENGLGEDYYIEAYQHFSTLAGNSDVRYPDSIARMIDEGCKESKNQLMLFYGELKKLSTSPLEMVSKPAKERMNKIEDVINLE